MKKKIFYSDNDLISIIIPIYNVSKYLFVCLDSVLSQTYKNIEVILVNDGSTDDSLNICNEYLSKDNRIILINQKNLGLSEARNSGLNIAKGNYICFVDSDDFIDANYVKFLYENLIENNADISACDFYYFDETKKWINFKKINETYSNIDAISDILNCESNIGVVAWNKLYKKSLFTDNNIEFPKNKIFEDSFIMYYLFYKSNKISFINKELYYYRQRSDSIINEKYSCKKLDKVEHVLELKKFLSDKKIDISVVDYETNIYLSLINDIIKSNYIKNDFNLVRGIIKKELIKTKKIKSLNINKKIKVYAVIYFKFVYIVLYKFRYVF